MGKISFLINGLQGGGAERVFISLANYFHGKGEEIGLIVGDLKGRKYEDGLDPGISVRVLGSQSARKCWWRLLRLLKKEGIRTIVVFSYQWALMLILLRMAFGLELKIIVRNINSISTKKRIDKSPWSRFLIFLVERLYKKADHFIAQCEGMKGELIRDFGIPGGRVTVIYNPVSPSFEGGETAGSGRADGHSGKPYFLLVGSFKTQKNVPDCLRAFSIFAKRNPEARLRLCGEGSLRPLISREIDRLGLSGQVIFEGFRADLRTLYAGALATLLTSHYEGFPNVLVESISMGTPVIAYDCPHGPREIIMEGENGFLVEPGDLQGFADRMGKVLRTPLDRAAVKRTSRRYSIENIGLQYFRLVKAISEG